jgi:phosphoribosylaminoimidazole-succinocarboxamide synthase
MQKVYTGKTKDVYQAEDGHYVLQFKDDVTGTAGTFDPGANTVGLTMQGAGRAGLRLSKYYFEKIAAAGIPTHYIDADVQSGTMRVLPARMFGNGVEVIVRYRAVGSFCRRYGMYAREGMPLDAYVEITLKDDERGDPLITMDALAALGIMDEIEYETLVGLARNIGEIIRHDLEQKGLELYDIKLEFGRLGEDGHIGLIDEISGGNMRVFEGNKAVDPLALAELVLRG